MDPIAFGVALRGRERKRLEEGIMHIQRRPVALSVFFLALLLPFFVDSRAFCQRADSSEAKWQLGYVPMKDGVKLAYILYKPQKEGRFPVLVRYDGDQGGATVATLEDKEYLVRGYALLGVSVRGTGSSEGVFTSPFGPQESADGKAVIDWAAEQPWCDGNVGMYGNSYAGVSQLEVAAQHPKALKALAAGGIWGDTYEDISYPGGMFNYGLIGTWSYLTQPYFWVRSARNRQFVADIAGAKRRAADLGSGKTFAEMRAHPFQDPWWELRRFDNLAPKLETPALIFQAWQEPQVGARGALRVFEKLHGPKRMLLSNGSDSLFGLRLLIADRVRWFDRWLKGKPNGIDKEPAVTVWFDTHEQKLPSKRPSETVSVPLPKSPAIPPGIQLRTPPIQLPPKPGWIARFPTWPIPDVHWSTLYLTADGKLDKAKPATERGSGPRAYLYPAGTEMLASNETISAPPAPVGSLTYRSRPLPEDLTIMGSPVLTVYASSEHKDTAFMAVLYDVNPKRQVTYVQHGLLRASHRALDPEQSRPHEPIYRHDKAEELNPGQVYEIKLALFPVAYVLRRGHFLELAILAPPSVPSPSSAFAPVTPPGLNTIYHSTQYPSNLELPVAAKLKAQAPDPPFGSLLSQPAREEPATGANNERKNLEEILRAWKREKLAPG
jgi:predicted acyl esterase